MSYDRLFFFIDDFLVDGLLNDLMGDNFFFHDERYFLLHNYRHLNLDSFNFSFMDLYLLILNSIPISLDRNFFDYLEWYSSLNLDFNNLLFNNSCLYNPRNLDLLDILLFYDYHLFDWNLDWHLYLLDYDLRDLNLDNLELCLFANHNFLDDLRHLNDFFNYSRDNYNLFDYFFNFNDPRNFYNLFDNSIDKLRLNFNYFSLYDNGNRFVNLDRFYNFLLCGYYLDIFNFNLLDFFAEVGLRNSFDHWYLLSHVKGYYFFNLNFLGSQDFLDDWLVYKHFNFSNDFLSVSFYEVRTVDKDFFRDFFDYLLLNFELDVDWLFDCVCFDNWLVSVLHDIYELKFRNFDFNWNLGPDFDRNFFLDDVWYLFLNFENFCFCDNLRHSYFNISDNFFVFIGSYNLLDNFFHF